MGYLAAFVINTAVTWVVLLLVILIGRKVADLSTPGTPELMWRLAIIAAACCGVALALESVNEYLGMAVAAVVFWTLMVKWFDVDLLGAFVLTIISWFVKGVIMMVLLSALRHALH